MMFQTQSPDGQAMMVTVTAVEGEQITIDGNHPLAGQVLNFKGKIDAVRDATEEEVAHGHVH
jgi:FKBP-type peptidyl-prolyl cis-trans isomerase SlyD